MAAEAGKEPPCFSVVIGPVRLHSSLGDMKPQAAALCALLALLFQKGIRAADTNREVGIRTNFVADAVLKPEELPAVVGLAKSCGMGRVASVE